MALLVQILLGVNMKDIIVKEGIKYFVGVTDESGTENLVEKSLDDILPIDRVVTIDNNNYVYLYDTCILITEDMIDEEL